MRAKVVFGRMGASAPIFFLCFFYNGQKFLWVSQWTKKTVDKKPLDKKLSELPNPPAFGAWIIPVLLPIRHK
jgi:hypothetical protein